MDLDMMLDHYFHTADLDQVAPDLLARGMEQIGLDFGVEQEPGRKFALWVLMEALGTAPPPAVAFEKEPKLRAAAEDWLRATSRMGHD